MDKHNKCWNKILKLIKFFHNLSGTFLRFFNPLQFKFHNCIIVAITYRLTIFQKNISCTLYIKDFCNKYDLYVNRKLFFLSISNFCWKNNILHCKYIGIMYIILQNLQLVFFLIYLSIKGFEKLFMRHFTICYIIIYCTTIVLNAFDKISYSMKFCIIENRLEKFCIYWAMIFKYNLYFIKPIERMIHIQKGFIVMQQILN